MGSLYNKYSSPIGTIRSQGVEVGLTGKLTDNLDLVFGFSTFSLKIWNQVKEVDQISQLKHLTF